MGSSDGEAFRPLLDRLGHEIVGGVMREGSRDTVDAIAARSGASRTVVREATRVLTAVGMLRAGRRVGLTVLPRSAWDFLDPQVIQWRLASPERDAQLRELRELRASIEPEAARYAATRRMEPQSAALREAADALVAAAHARDATMFLKADRRFHLLLLAAARNPTVERLGSVIEEALRVQAPRDDVHWALASGDAERHAELAIAVAQGDGEVAATLMRLMIEHDHAPRPDVTS